MQVQTWNDEKVAKMHKCQIKTKQMNNWNERMGKITHRFEVVREKKMNNNCCMRMQRKDGLGTAGKKRKIEQLALENERKRNT